MAEAQLNFEAYGTRIGVRSNNVDTIEYVEKMLPEHSADRLE